MLTRRQILSAIVSLPLGLIGKWKPQAEAGYIATPKNTPPCQVFDANGKEWRYMLWVHTGTGEGCQYVLDANGQKQLTADMRSILTQDVSLPSPLRLVPTGNGQLPHCSYQSKGGSLAIVSGEAVHPRGDGNA